MDSVVESALQPGRFIRWNEGVSFVSNLRHRESEIANIVTSDPARAVTLYETFIAGCNLKAEEIDDSDGELGTFAGGLFCGWIQARQAAGADCGDTAKLLLAWMDQDDGRRGQKRETTGARTGLFLPRCQNRLHAIGDLLPGESAIHAGRQ